MVNGWLERLNQVPGVDAALAFTPEGYSVSGRFSRSFAQDVAQVASNLSFSIASTRERQLVTFEELGLGGPAVWAYVGSRAGLASDGQYVVHFDVEETNIAELLDVMRTSERQ